MGERLAADYGISNLSMHLGTLLGGSVGAWGEHLNAIAPVVDGQPVPIHLELTPVFSRFMNGRHGILARGRDMRQRYAEEYGGAAGNEDLVDRRTGLDREYDWSEHDEVFERVISGHASFKDETPGVGPKGVLFAGIQESLNQLDLVSTAVGRRLPGVVYGRQHGVGARYVRDYATAKAQDRLWTPFSDTTVQPKPADFEAIGISEYDSAEEIIDAWRRRGITGGTLGVGHIQAFRDPLALTEKLGAAGWLVSAHLELNRDDQASYGGDFVRSSAQAKQAFTESADAAAKTLEGELLCLVVAGWKKRGYRGRIFYEGRQPVRASRRQVRNDHVTILDNTIALAESV
jgi:hypothetical protein